MPPRYPFTFSLLFFFNDTATTEIYTLSLHDALPIFHTAWDFRQQAAGIREDIHSMLDQIDDRTRRFGDRKSTRLNSSHTVISYAVFCLKKKNKSDSNVG